jgi:hypothetical protein
VLKKAAKKALATLGYKIAPLNSGDEQFRENEIAFLHIGKNAGTQIVHLTRQLECYGLKVKKLGHSVKRSSIPSNVPYFFSIRDPVSRFKSGFYSRKRKGMPRIYSEWNEHEKLAFNHFDHANDLAEALWRRDCTGNFAAMAIQSISHTAMQQIDWFTCSAFIDSFPPLWIIRQEKFEDDFNELLSRLNLDLRLSNLSLASESAAAHANDYSGSPQLSDLAVENLNKWYARDLAFYEICVDWIEKNKAK